MKVNAWLADAQKHLEAANVPSARLDALILLEDATEHDRAWLLAHPEQELTEKVVEKLSVQLERRQAHEPLAYIRGRSEFYGREFLVTPATLQPRPETETIIELLKKHCESSPYKVVDVGTGSGCIAVTVKLEFPETEVSATEINTDALLVARQNAKQLGADIKFYQGNLLAPLLNQGNADIVLANLPYVPDSHTINDAAMHEPRVAIFGGEDGLDLYRELFSQLRNEELVITESLPFQHEALAHIAHTAGYSLTETEDFIQVFSRRK